MGPPRQQALSIDVPNASKPTATMERELPSMDIKKNTTTNKCSILKVQAQTPSTRQSCESLLFRFEEEDESDEDIGDGGVLTETQLVLLCLDYLRTLSRSYTTEELRTCHSMDRGAILKATDSLRQSFLPTSSSTSTTTTTTPSGSSHLLQPAQLHIDNDPVRPTHTPTSSTKNNPHKLEYDDSHPSNRYRFFPLNGLSTPPLTLGEIVASGLVGLNARSRGEAELDICSNELFHQFLGAVKARGFFATTTHGNQEDDITSPTNTNQTERYQKVVDKFRMKLAANAAKEAQAASRLSPLSVYSSTSTSPTTMTHHRLTTATTATTPYTIASPKNIPYSTTSITTATMTTRPDSTRVLAMTMAEKQRVHQQKQQQRQQPYSFDDHDDDYTTNAAKPAMTSTCTRDVEQREEQNEDEGEEENNDMIETYNPVDVQRAEKYKLSGNNYNEAGKFDKAVECYTQALQLCPSGSNSHIYYSNRSAAYLGLERYEDCLDDCERALALKPDYVKAYTRMGWALFYLKEYEYAMDSFEMSMKLDPTNVHAHRDPYLKAREAWEKEQRQQQQQQGPRKEELSHTNNQNTYFHDNDNNSPKSATSSQTSPRTATSATNGMDEESRRNRESMIRQKEADGYKSKGNSYMAHRDWVRAVEAYSTAIQLCPNGPRSYIYFANRSAALCHLQQYEEAELDAADSVALNPEYGKAYARLGLSRFFLEDYHGAVEAYENAIYYEPDNAASKSYLAKAKKRILELNGSDGNTE
jgi:tetratricopeptide (TPR) repeat protein